MENNQVKKSSPLSIAAQTDEPVQMSQAPYQQMAKPRKRADLVAVSKPNSAHAETLRVLRSQLMLRWFNSERRVLAVVSANENEGCSHVAANLAVLFAQLGLRTLLIDANLRAPKQSEIFNIQVSTGLSELLAVDANIEIIPHAGPVDNLSIICAGAVPANPLELLSRKSFAQLIQQVTLHFDIILVDTSPIMVSADAQTVVASCGGAMVVSRLNETKLADLTEVKSQIDITGAQIVGSVVNQI